MLVEALVPSCPDRINFSKYDLRQVPRELGCYVLSNYQEEILYIGQGYLHSRMNSHLNSHEKTTMTKMGKIFWFNYIVANKTQLNKIEGGWVQQHEDREGEKPILNKIQPPS